MSKSIREALDNYADDSGAELLLIDGFDEAIIGIATRHCCSTVVAYSREKCIEILARDMSLDEAEDYFSFNVEGAYVGELTPVFVSRLDNLDES